MIVRLFSWTLIAMPLLAMRAAAFGDEAPVLTPAQSGYLEHCGGCHGIQGSSARREIPELSGVVGMFMRSVAGRRYLVQIPDVAFANLTDEALADVMNFVVFEVGAASAPVAAARYSAAEVRELRSQPLKNRDIGRVRREIIADL
jgi:hypothetical protein